MQVKEVVLGTIQFQTSKPHVMIRLSILDQTREVARKTGQGHVGIPAFNFLPNDGEHPLDASIQHIITAHIQMSKQ